MPVAAAHVMIVYVALPTGESPKPDAVQIAWTMVFDVSKIGAL
jgi:hypothetical protein